MRKITLITLIFTLMFSSTSFADWTEVTENSVGDTYFVDFERIRKHDGYVYWWELGDFLKTTESGFLSIKVYWQGDCQFLRHKSLSYSFHNEPMGRGTGAPLSPPEKWRYPPPDSSSEFILKSVCEYAN